MDQQTNEILEDLEFYMSQIRKFNFRLEDDEHVEQDELEDLHNNFHIFMSELEPSNIPDRTTFLKTQRLIKDIIEQLEVFLRLVGADPDEKIGLSEERIAQFYSFDFKHDDGMTGQKCSACLKFFFWGDELVKLDCEDIVHKKCAKDWFADLNFCPNCNQVFT